MDDHGLPPTPVTAPALALISLGPCLSVCLCVCLYVCVCIQYVPLCRCESSSFCFVGHPQTSRTGQANPGNSDSRNAAATSNKRQECPPQEHELSSSSLSLKLYHTAWLAMMMHGANDDDDDDDDATYDPSKCPAMKQRIRAQNQILHGPDLPTAYSRRESPKTKTKKKRRRRSLTPLYFAIAESSVVFSISSLQFSDTFHFLALLEFPPVMHLQFAEYDRGSNSIDRAQRLQLSYLLIDRFFSTAPIFFRFPECFLLSFSSTAPILSGRGTHGQASWTSHGWPTTVQMGV